MSSRFSKRCGDHRALPSFPTRRSSDLKTFEQLWSELADKAQTRPEGSGTVRELDAGVELADRDRKSTRLNSSHGSISYAVFCLTKKHRTAVNLPIDRRDGPAPRSLSST